MNITFLGTGTSTGVPQIGCECPVCRSTDMRDKRLRCSGLIEVNGQRILIDCGPDFREQMIRLNDFRVIDAVLITHEHYDHVGGLDDLRPFCVFGDMTVYAEHYTAERLRQRIPYCFAEQLYPGVPRIELKELTALQPFTVGSVEIMPIRVFHVKMPILGYRIGKMAWITDMLELPDVSLEQLKDLDVLVLNALRREPHISHQTLEQALSTAKRVGARQTYLIHMSHQMGLHSEVSKILPDTISLAYDGLSISL